MKKQNSAQRSASKDLYNIDIIPKSATEDIVDPIYDKKDPISASIRLRKEGGSIMSIIRDKNFAANMDGSEFFYTMGLVGTGLENPKKQNGDASHIKKPRKYLSPEKAIRKRIFDQYKN